ncbi:MAG: VanZ family protein [Chitinophagaceae bacterium]
MRKQRKSTRILLWGLLMLTMLVLTKNILFKRSPRFYKNYFTHQYQRKQVVKEGWKNANWKLFSTIRLYYYGRVSEELKYKNLGGNIIGFIPLGILLPLLFSRLRKGWKTILAVFMISLLFESTQLYTGLGVFDVDDLLLNTIGGLAGYLLYFIGMNFFFSHNLSENKYSATG